MLFERMALMMRQRGGLRELERSKATLERICERIGVLKEFGLDARQLVAVSMLSSQIKNLSHRIRIVKTPLINEVAACASHVDAWRLSSIFWMEECSKGHFSTMNQIYCRVNQTALDLWLSMYLHS